jgi:hypothetical protein
MNTIFISVYPKPNGPNVTQLCVDFNQFDPHEGIRFSVVMKNPEGLTLDRTYTNLTGDDWQDWPSEQTSQADYDYVKKVVLDNLGYTEAIAPFFISQPQSLKVIDGSTAQFAVQASGDAPLSYQWYKNQQLISGANSNEISIINVNQNDIGNYYVKVENPLAAVDSDKVDLSIYIAPSVIINPVNISVPSGAEANFSASFNGDLPMNIEWLKDNQIIPNATSNNYIITGVTDADIGTYKAKATNIAGSIETSGASLSIIEPTPPTPPEPVPTGIMP